MENIKERKMINNIVNNIQVGDKVVVNDWELFMDVRGVSDHYIVMANDISGEYSIIGKLMNDGKFYCGPDDYIFGSPLANDYDNFYEFKDEEATAKYLAGLESEEFRMSWRRRMGIYSITVVHPDGNAEIGYVKMPRGLVY